MTCRIQIAGFLAVLIAGAIFVMVAQFAGGLVWRGYDSTATVDGAGNCGAVWQSCGPHARQALRPS